MDNFPFLISFFIAFDLRNSLNMSSFLDSVKCPPKVWCFRLLLRLEALGRNHMIYFFQAIYLSNLLDVFSSIWSC